MGRRLLAMTLAVVAGTAPTAFEPGVASAVETPIAIDRTAINFGVIPVGGSLAISATLTNTGAVPFGPINMFGGAPNPPVFGASQSCQGATLAVGGTCKVNYEFEPTVEGAYDSVSNFVISPTSNQSDGEEFSVALTGKTSAAQPLAALEPARLLDTRPGKTTVDGLGAGIGERPAGSVTEVVVIDRGGVASGAVAVFLNVTAVAPKDRGHLIVFPCGTDPPRASNVNYQAGDVVPNAVLAKIGTGGKVCIYTHATTHLLVDVNGYVPSGGSPAPVAPARLLDTRPTGETIDGLGAAIGEVAGGSITEVLVRNRADVPPGAAAAFLNVTAVAPEGAGHLIVFPCGTDPPTASNVNYQAGDVVPNAVLAKIGTGGKVCIYTHATTHLVVDLNGFVPALAPASLAPARLLDTRPGKTTVDGLDAGIGGRSAGSITELSVRNRGGVPNTATAVFLNVTAVAPTRSGHLIVFPCGTTPPTTSNVNYQAGDVVPNAVLAKIGTGGLVCIYTHAATHLVVDVNGYVR